MLSGAPRLFDLDGRDCEEAAAARASLAALLLAALAALFAFVAACLSAVAFAFACLACSSASFAARRVASSATPSGYRRLQLSLLSLEELGLVEKRVSTSDRMSGAYDRSALSMALASDRINGTWLAL